MVGPDGEDAAPEFRTGAGGLGNLVFLLGFAGGGWGTLFPFDFPFPCSLLSWVPLFPPAPPDDPAAAPPRAPRRDAACTCWACCCVCCWEIWGCCVRSERFRGGGWLGVDDATESFEGLAALPRVAAADKGGTDLGAADDAMREAHEELAGVPEPDARTGRGGSGIVILSEQAFQ